MKKFKFEKLEVWDIATSYNRLIYEISKDLPSKENTISLINLGEPLHQYA